MAQIKKMQVRLQTLTPLHIGGSEGSLSPLEFAYCDGKVYVISPERWTDWLSKNKALDEFLRPFKVGQTTSLQAYLENKGLLKPEFLGSIARYTVQSALAPRGDLRAFIRNGYQQPYIPGSSIKGMLRVAMLYVLLQKVPDAERERLVTQRVEQGLQKFEQKLAEEQSYWQTHITNSAELDRKLRGLRRNLQERYKKFFAGQLDQEVLQSFRVSNYWNKIGPNTDIPRALEISDGEPFERDSLTVEEIKVHSAGAGIKTYSIFAECLPPGIEFTVDVNIDLDLLDLFKRNNLRTTYGLDFAEVESALLDPFRMAKTLAQKLLTHERTFLEKELQVSGALGLAEEPDVRLGWGGGLLGTTVDLLLREPLRQQIRNKLFVDRNGASAPKSRRLTTAGQPLGWCKIVAQEVI